MKFLDFRTSKEPPPPITRTEELRIIAEAVAAGRVQIIPRGMVYDPPAPTRWNHGKRSRKALQDGWLAQKNAVEKRRAHR